MLRASLLSFMAFDSCFASPSFQVCTRPRPGWHMAGEVGGGVGGVLTNLIVLMIEEEAITSSSHIRLIRWTQPVSRNRSRNTNESQ